MCNLNGSENLRNTFLSFDETVGILCMSVNK